VKSRDAILLRVWRRFFAFAQLLERLKRVTPGSVLRSYMKAWAIDFVWRHLVFIFPFDRSMI
jgi:hypothetical protein